MNLHSFRTFLLSAYCVMALGACAYSGIGISIPIGPFGSVGIGVSGTGQVTGNVGVGTNVGGVGIGGGTSFPMGTVGGTPAGAPPTPQTGASQNVPPR